MQTIYDAMKASRNPFTVAAFKAIATSDMLFSMLPFVGKNGEGFRYEQGECVQGTEPRSSVRLLERDPVIRRRHATARPSTPPRTHAPGYCWVPNSKQLTPKEQRFVDEYLIDRLRRSLTEPPALDPNRDRSAEVRQQFREARSGWT